MGETDLSDFSYEEWVAFFFAHGVDVYGDLWDKYDLSVQPRQPERLIAHLTRLCQEFSTLPTLYSWGQINQGVWAVLSHPGGMAEALMRPNAPLELRLECVRAMYHVYADAIAHLEPALPMENGFYMWWELIGDCFCLSAGHGGDRPFLPKDADARQMHDTILSTLVRVLQLGEERCASAALHGLGHLHHPDGAGIVQEYIDKRQGSLSPEDLEWLQQCRDGTVM